MGLVQGTSVFSATQEAVFSVYVMMSLQWRLFYSIQILPCIHDLTVMKECQILRNAGEI